MKERNFWVIWSKISGIGYTLIRRLENHFDRLENAWLANPKELLEVSGFGNQLINVISEYKQKNDPEKIIEEHQKQNPYFCTPIDVEYPRLLLEINSPPCILYYLGKWDEQESLGNTKAIAMVGTRSPSDYGKLWTRKISTILAQNGLTIVSGMAEGIDTEAHQTCVDMQKRTIAVLGTGIDVIYPASNRKLYQKIAETGLILSEYPAKTRPERANFPRRNRIIAGLSRATLVIEAPLKSGALITAQQAIEYGRDVYALPGRIDDLKSQGCLQLIANGAYIINNTEELLEKLGGVPPLDTKEQLSLFSPSIEPNLSPELAQILQVISSEPILFDVILQKTGLDAGQLSSLLLELELSDLISQLPGMRYQRKN